MTHPSMNVDGGADVLSDLSLGHAVQHQAGGDHPVSVVADGDLGVLAAPDHLGPPGVIDPGPGDGRHRGGGHQTLQSRPPTRRCVHVADT